VDKEDILDSARLRGNAEVVPPMFIMKAVKLGMPKLKGLFMIRTVVPFVTERKTEEVRMHVPIIKK
jgi:hypothetical protein